MQPPFGPDRPSRARRLLGTVGATLTALVLTGCTAATGIAPTSSGAPAAAAPASSASAPAGAAVPPTSSAGTPVRIVVGDRALSARLNDTPTARDLAGRLPVTLTFEPHNSVERTGRISPALTMDGAPSASDPVPRDLGYYAPSTDVVLYNGDAGSFSGIVIIGRMDGDLSVITDERGAFRARIERAG